MSHHPEYFQLEATKEQGEFMTGIGLKAGRPSAQQPSVSLSDLREDTVRLNVDIDKSLHKKLKLRAVEEERSIALIVRELLEKALIE